jgi:hypothetical protein
MTNTLALSKTPKRTPLTPPKPEGLSEKDLVLVAERLSLIQGHYSAILSVSGVAGGARVRRGYLLVALKIPDLAVDPISGVWSIGGKDITQLTESGEK